MTTRYLVNEPWAKVPLSLVTASGITLSDVQLYVYLDGRAGRRGWWYGSQREISEATGLPNSTIRHSLDRLITAGYVARERMGSEYATVLRYLILARTVAVDDTDRVSEIGQSVAEIGQSDRPKSDTLTSLCLTDPEPQKKKVYRNHGSLERVIRRT